MTTSPSLAQPEIQAALISEALASAGVGFLVWDENRRYIAANDAACEILGTTLDALLGQQVGAHTIAGAEALEEALAGGFSSGRAVVERRRPWADQRLLCHVHDEDCRDAVHGDDDRSPAGVRPETISSRLLCAA